MRWRWHEGKLIPVHEWAALQPRRLRSNLPAPAIRCDGMDATLNHADGQTYESRSAYDRALRAKGCHILEGGEQTGEAREPEEVGGLEQDIKTAIEQLEGQL